MKSEHKKTTYEDRFARKYYCQHARLGYTRYTKRSNSKAFRKYNKDLCKGEY